MKVEFVPIDLIADYENNSNVHPEQQIHQIKALMQYNGWTVPALVRRIGKGYELIAGHGRKQAAQELYDEGATLKTADGTPIPIGCIPTLFADNWSEEQVRAYVIADNKVAHGAYFDNEKLAEELAVLQEADFDLSLTSFDDTALERLLHQAEDAHTEYVAEDSQEVGLNDLETEHICPKCGYEFS